MYVNNHICVVAMFMQTKNNMYTLLIQSYNTYAHNVIFLSS